MRLGRLHLRVMTRSPEALRERFDAAACFACLVELVHALAGHQWMVVAGLVEPLLRGAFSRAHSDVDIAVPLAHLDGVARAAVAVGYVMTTRLMRSKLPHDGNLELHLRLEPGGLMLELRPRRLRLWRLDARGEFDENRFPPYVDVFPFVADDKELRILDGGWRLPLGLPIVRAARLADGVEVPVVDPSYVQALRVLRTQTARS
jgi:hypothetical protein